MPTCNTQKKVDLIETHLHQPLLMKSKLGVQRQALETLRTAVDSCEHPVFPCALIAGDVVILELLAKLDYLKTGKVAVAFVDTFHLFPETITFLKQLEVCCVFALLPVFSVNGQASICVTLLRNLEQKACHCLVPCTSTVTSSHGALTMRFHTTARHTQLGEKQCSHCICLYRTSTGSKQRSFMQVR